jgi:hypothetical protein
MTEFNKANILYFVNQVVWDDKVSSTEKIIMLKLMDLYGDTEFSTNLDSLAHELNIKKDLAGAILRKLKSVGWVDSSFIYEDGSHNLKFRRGSKYKIVIKDSF